MTEGYLPRAALTVADRVGELAAAGAALLALALLAYLALRLARRDGEGER